MDQNEGFDAEVLPSGPARRRLPGRTVAVAFEGLAIAVGYALYSAYANGMDVFQVSILLVIGFVLLVLGGAFRPRVNQESQRLNTSHLLHS